LRFGWQDIELHNYGDMIEVRLTEREQPHPAMDNPNGWMGKRGTFWEWPRGLIENMTDEQHRTLSDAIDEFIRVAEEHYGQHLAELIRDYEICGSDAFGNQTWWSDLDIQLSTGNRAQQDKLQTIINTDYIWWKQRVAELSHRMKIAIELCFSHSNNKEYNECYSLRDRKLYNRSAVRLSSYHRKYDPHTGKYEVYSRESTDRFGRIIPPFYESAYWDRDGNLLHWRKDG
jgi:hypothetical protein